MRERDRQRRRVRRWCGTPRSAQAGHESGWRQLYVVSAVSASTGVVSPTSRPSRWDFAHGLAVSPVGQNVYVAATISDAVSAFDTHPPACDRRRSLADVAGYDVDGDGAVEPLTDGVLLLRHTFGFTGATLIGGAVDLANCTRCTAPGIEAFIEALLE